MTTDEGEIVLLGKRVYSVTDVSFDTAAVNHDTVFFEIVSVFGDVINSCLRIKRNDDYVTTGDPIFTYGLFTPAEAARTLVWRRSSVTL